jgi:hypothetical protein
MSRHNPQGSAPHQQTHDGAILLETDPRFPSGPWVGFWIQQGLGRKWMRLRLKFLDGRVTGDGHDCIGRFLFHGSYDLSTGAVELVKTYLGQHEVEYAGRNEDDGLWLWGVWQVKTFDRGGFHIWPEWENDPTQRRLGAEEDLPIEQEQRVLVGTFQ